MDEELMDDGLGMTEVRPGRSRVADVADDDFDVTARPGLAVEAFLRGLGPDLLPNARERLSKQFGLGASEGGLINLVNYLNDSHNCERYMRPGATQADASPLRGLIKRFEQAGLLQKGAADELHDELAIDIHPQEMRTNPGRVAAKIWDELHDHKPERRMLWTSESRPPMGHRQQKVAQALTALGFDFLPSRTEELCYRFRDAADGNRPLADVIRTVAYRLNRDGIRVDPATVASAIRTAAPAPSPDAFRAVGYERM